MIPHIILAASLMAAQTTSLQTAPSACDGLAELRGITRADDLGALRAGAPALVRPIDDQERADLQAAANSATDLASMRGGVMTDHDWMVVGVVLLGVLLLVLIF